MNNKEESLTQSRGGASRQVMRIGFLTAGLLALGGCVQVAAPERPIEINLNINIRQEVVVGLRDDARELIERNRGVF